MARSMIRSIALGLLLAPFWAATALANPPIYGPLQAQNALHEILVNGTQSQAQANLGLDGPPAVTLNKINSIYAPYTIIATATTTYSSGTYTALKGAQALPPSLAAGQVFMVNFNQANPGAASLNLAGLGTKPLKVINSAGTVLSMVGGEIVKGPATVYYDGTEFVYQTPVSANQQATAATTLTQANFAGFDIIYTPSGAETITLPCSSTISSNGRVGIFSTDGTITVQTTSSGCTPTDAIIKNNSSATSQTIAQGNGFQVIVTDGNGHYYLSGS
jgi:hypothetical protein